ncbi:MAG TPA: glucose-6-phosphate dehydrogenase [Roseiarcus sp.]|nr:glucose-6-phosphate dehydrogenase [Roseiarcus sp.]
MSVPAKWPHGSAAGVKPAPPCTLVIFGAAGDLTKRLLTPSLYDLAVAGLLDEKTAIIGVDHADLNDQTWTQSLSEALRSFTADKSAEFHAGHIERQAWDWLSRRLSYCKADFDDDAAFATLGKRLSGNVVFYLAVGARFFGPIVTKLGASGLLKEKPDAFRRVIVEKPFGGDLASAEALNRVILAAAEERQVFRIDHFLGKDMVQSILAIRFANRMFEPIWRADHVDHVQITAAETVGVEKRGAFYETTGALRDMAPNHLFQLLCMAAMEAPGSFDAEAVRSEKAKLVRAVRPIQPGDAARGQYAAGRLDGRALPGYRDEPHVAKDSRTETYAALKLTIETGRWAGVPFYLRTGKRLKARKTEIALCFKPTAYDLLADKAGLAPNILRLQIDPEHGARAHFNVKAPGPEMTLADVATVFRYQDAFPQRPNVGYEALLYDCMIGDATLFQRADNIEAGWAAVQPLLDAWRSGAPEPYPVGAAGPAGADALIAKDGRAWLPLAQD